MQMSLDDNRRQNYERLFAYIDFISDPTMTMEHVSYTTLRHSIDLSRCGNVLLVFSSRIVRFLFVLMHELYDERYNRDAEGGDENIEDIDCCIIIIFGPFHRLLSLQLCRLMCEDVSIILY